MSAPPASVKKAKVSIPEGRRELLDLLKTARAMEERRLNPFHLDVAEALELADRYFPAWKAIEDLMLDARALNALSRVVKMQEGRLRYQAQLFHADPEAVAEKLTKLGTDQLAKLFLGAWHPAVEVEQLTEAALEEALDYWNELEPLSLRQRQRPRREPPPPETVTIDDLLARGVLVRDGIGSAIADLWDDLKGRGEADYHEFIRAPTHGEKVRRAYATSYLVTYGYAVLSRNGDEKLVLRPKGEREPPQASVSLPIAV